MRDLIANKSLEGKPVISEQLIGELIRSAKQAVENAYCDYSRFPVGATVLTTTGNLYAGCNIENASYGLTICAERTAVFNAVSSGEREIAAVAIYTPTKKPTAPCGACRQVINEFGPKAIIICTCDGSDPIRRRLDALLPSAFGPNDLAFE